MCIEGKIEGADHHGMMWINPDPPSRIDAIPDGHVTFTQAAKKLGVTRQRVYELIKADRVEGAT